jgi:hypothetical protein
MILSVDREPVLGRIERDPVGHRERHRHPTVLESQIPVQTGRVVLLDDEPGLIGPRQCCVARRLGRRREVTLPPVTVELVVRHRWVDSAA